VSGPFCTNQLRLLGAEVIKVERPDGGDDFRSRREPSGQASTFNALNAGKRSVVLDLKGEEGRRLLLGLVAQSDVLVENFRPGVMDELGLTWERLQASNPRLVYCSISGFGQRGDLREVPAIEWSVQAASGMTDAYVDPRGDPLRLGLSVLDPFTGYMAFARILTALRERDLTGKGQRLDVAMLDAAFTLMWPQVVETAASEPGRARPRLGRRGTMARFPSADGMVFIAALHQRWFEALCEELDVSDLARDERFADSAARAAHPDEVYEAVAARTRAFPGADLVARLTTRGIPASVVTGLEEAMTLPQVVERGLLDAADRTGPELGADTESVLAELRAPRA
ncbi:MAG: CoA transferase, partial [Candidatus Dormibacteraeota bacterium]|nr:CoA transferase [Candidatus Dormibacteraeota bacterium]